MSLFTALCLIPVPLNETFELINKVCSRRLQIISTQLTYSSLCTPFRYIMSLSYLGRERDSSTAWEISSVEQKPWWGESLWNHSIREKPVACLTWAVSAHCLLHRCVFIIYKKEYIFFILLLFYSKNIFFYYIYIQFFIIILYYTFYSFFIL